MAIYVCSDIHGQYALYEEMLKKIHFSDDDFLYIIGDVVDRGSDSMKLLLDVMNRPNMELLLGNHELMMHDHLTRTDYDRIRGDRKGEYWLYDCNGGKKSKREYLKLSDTTQKEILDYIKGLYLQRELHVNGSTILLSHSYFLADEPDVKWADVDWETAFDVVWCSPWRRWEYAPMSAYGEDKRFHVIGHVPVQMVFGWDVRYETEGVIPKDLERHCIDIENNILNIDYGCARLGVPDFGTEIYSLCCLNLEEFTKDHEKGFVFIRPDVTVVE